MEKQNEYLDDEMNVYIKTIERYLEEYSGYRIRLYTEKDKDDVINLNGDINIPLNYSDRIQFIDKFMDYTWNLVADEINLKEELNWNIFDSLKNKLSSFFIFGQIKNDKEEYKRLQFMKDLINLCNKTYEGHYPNIGVIYIHPKEIKEIARQFNFKVINFETEKSIIELFDNEKPLLKISEGENLNILVNSDFNVYGVAVSVKDDVNISQTIVQTYEDEKIMKSMEYIKNYIVKSFMPLKIIDKVNEKSGIGVETVEKVVSYIDEKIKSSVNLYIKNKDIFSNNMIYFKLGMGELNVYNAEDFIICFSKGEWKLKNFNVLRIILIDYIITHRLVYILLETPSLGTNEVVEEIVEGMNVLFNTIIKLSSMNTSSILLLTKNTVNDEYVYNTALNKEQVDKILSELPFKKQNKDYLYLKVIQENDVYLNLKDVGVSFLSNLCTVDGAVVLDDSLNILGYSEVINVDDNCTNVFGTGTNACMVGSKNDRLAIKISADREIKVYRDGSLILNL